MPVPSGQNLIDGGLIEALEARAKEKRKQYLTEQKVYQQSLITFETLREELEETERAIGDFDDGTCPVCHNNPAKTFADLKAKRTELETKLAKANEEKIVLTIATLIVSIGGVFGSLKVIKHLREDGEGFEWGLAGVVSALLWGLLFYMLYVGLVGWFNPEYMALKDILRFDK
jgi:hypothetical protein